MKLTTIICIWTMLIFIFGCSNTSKIKPGPEAKTGVKESVRKTGARDDIEKASKQDTAKCLAVDTGDKDILESQTFAIEFKPFNGSCFVTTHDAGRTDPPIGSVISIYRNGKQIYKFDSRFNENAAGCWVEAVSFQDLTEDGLTDVIVLGMCGAKSGDIQGNEVFINTGKDFRTDVGVNDQLEKFKTVEEVADFVRQNEQLFKR